MQRLTFTDEHFFQMGSLSYADIPTMPLFYPRKPGEKPSSRTTSRISVQSAETRRAETLDFAKRPESVKIPSAGVR